MKIFQKLLLFWFLYFTTCFSAKITGFVVDKKTGEHIAFANIIVLKKNIGCTANSNGYFELAVPSDKLVIRASSIGYKPQEKVIMINEDEELSLFFNLEQDLIQTNEIVSTADRYKEDLGAASISFNAKEIKAVPFIAEPDPMRAMQALPGVTSVNDFTNRLYVRGGNFDETMLSFDGAPVYNINHLGTFFSTFNNDIFQSAKLYPSNYPVNYGGYLSSVFELQTKDGIGKLYKTSANISLISSKVFIEGPVSNGNFVFAARRTYFDLIEMLIDKFTDEKPNIPYYFYDIFAKYSYSISNTDRVKAELFYTKDIYDIYKSSSYENVNKNIGEIPNWSNILFQFVWDHSFSKATNMELKIFKSESYCGSDAFINKKYYIRYNRLLDEDLLNQFTYVNNTISDHTVSFDLKTERDIHNIRAGLEFKKIDLNYYWSIRENELEDTFAPVTPEDLFFDFAPNPYKTKKKSDLLSFYANDVIDISDIIKTSIGIRGAYFSNLKAFNYSPYLNIKYIFKPGVDIHFSAGKYYQYLYALKENINNMNYAFSPMSVLFTPNDKDLIPTSTQYSLGLTIEEIVPDVKLDIEGYLKNYKNLASSYNYSNTIYFEDGRAYGLDIMLAKFRGFITGWLGYSLSRSLKYGNDYTYYSAQDRLHNLKLFSEFNISEHFKVGLFYIFATGIHFTPYQYKYMSLNSLSKDEFEYFRFFRQQLVTWRIFFGKKNSERAPDYKRLDLSISSNFVWYKLLFTPYIQVMNALNQKNAIFNDYDIYDISQTPNRKEQIGSMIIPSFGVNVEYQF